MRTKSRPTPLDFGAPLPDDLSVELEKLFSAVVLGVHEKKRRSQAARDAFVALDHVGFPLSRDRALSKIRGAKAGAIACFQGRAPFVLLDVAAPRRARAFADALLAEEGEMHAVFVPTFAWCITRNHDTPPASLSHVKPERLRGRPECGSPVVPHDRVADVVAHISGIVQSPSQRGDPAKRSRPSSIR